MYSATTRCPASSPSSPPPCSRDSPVSISYYVLLYNLSCLHDVSTYVSHPGVYFERILKGSAGTSLWVRNVQMGLPSVTLALVGIASSRTVSDSDMHIYVYIYMGEDIYTIYYILCNL